jgi:hypothetical protein
MASEYKLLFGRPLDAEISLQPTTTMNHAEAFQWVFRRRNIERSVAEWETVKRAVDTRRLPIHSSDLYCDVIKFNSYEKVSVTIQNQPYKK